MEVNGTSAIARCHVRGWHYAKGTAGGDEWMVAGHYVSQLGKAGTTWRIRTMKLETLDQTGNAKLLEIAGGQ